MNNQIGLFEHFRLLFAFRGREDVGSFWPYAALVFAIMTILNMLVMIPLMSMSVTNILENGMPPQVSTFVTYYVVMTLLGFGLYAAAVVRRLRDAGLSPWWALLPLPFAIAANVGFNQMMGSPYEVIAPDTGMIQLMLAGSVLQMLSMLLLFFMLTMRSAGSSVGKGKKPIPHYHEE